MKHACPAEPGVGPDATEEFRADLLREATRLLGDPWLAEDAVQETYLRFLVAPPRQRGAPRAWLLRVLRNQCVDQLRHRRRQGIALARLRLTLPLASTEPLPAAVACALEARDDIDRAVRGLPPAQRAVFQLSLSTDLSHAAMARHFDCAERTISTRIARARERCRGALARHGLGRRRGPRAAA